MAQRSCPFNRGGRAEAEAGVAGLGMMAGDGPVGSLGGVNSDAQLMSASSVRGASREFPTSSFRGCPRCCSDAPAADNDVPAILWFPAFDSLAVALILCIRSPSRLLAALVSCSRLRPTSPSRWTGVVLRPLPALLCRLCAFHGRFLGPCRGCCT